MLVGALFGVKCYRKRRKQETNSSAGCSDAKDPVKPTAQDMVYEADGREHAYEIDNGITPEMDGKGITAEIQGIEPLVEME